MAPLLVPQALQALGVYTLLDTLLHKFRQLLWYIGWTEVVVSLVLLFSIVASVGTQVISRYLFNNPLIWVEEGVVYAFIWSVFLGASIGLKTQRHIRIEWLSHIAGPRTESGLYLLRQIVVVTIVILVFPYALTVMGTESRSTTVSLPWNLPRFLFFSLPLTTSFVLMGVTAFYFFLEGLRALPQGTKVAPILTFQDDEFDDVEELMETS